MPVLYFRRLIWCGEGNEHIDKAGIPNHTDATSVSGDTRLGLSETQKRRQEMVEGVKGFSLSAMKRRARWC